MAVSLDHTLTAYLADAPAESSVLRIFRRILEAVDAIHAAGSLHPPLSPETIRFDASNQPHIPSSKPAHESADTVAFGSPKYSAPEAFSGRDKMSSCEAIDCYVLGFMFYEILIGRRSFVAQFGAIENGPPSSWLKWHADRSARVRPLSEVRPNLGHFAGVIDGMTKKDAATRITSISQVLRAFTSLDIQTTSNVDPVASPGGREISFMREGMSRITGWFGRLARSRKWLVAAAAILVAVIVGLALLLDHQRSPEPLRSSAPAMPPVKKPITQSMPTPVHAAQPVGVDENLQREIPMDSLPAGLIKLDLAPGKRSLLIPVKISANVPDAQIVINGEKLRRRLDNGMRVVRLRAGEYRVKLVRPEYQDSAEQTVVITGEEQAQQLQFTLARVESPPPATVSSTAAPDLRADLEALNISEPALNDSTLGVREDKPDAVKTERTPALKPTDFFENGQTWTVDSQGWWTHAQPGYSFMRANQGTFTFDILKPSGLFSRKKVSLVIDYKGESNRVLYTVDEHRLRRDERAPGPHAADYSVPLGIPTGSNYRLTVELSPDRVIIRNAAGTTLDNLALADLASGKVAFWGKVKLRVVEAKYGASAGVGPQ